MRVFLNPKTVQRIGQDGWFDVRVMMNDMLAKEYPHRDGKTYIVG